MEKKPALKIKKKMVFVKVGEKCKDCELSNKSTTPNIKLKCAHARPMVVFDRKCGYWMCASFSPKIKRKEAKNNDA